MCIKYDVLVMVGRMDNQSDLSFSPRNIMNETIAASSFALDPILDTLLDRFVTGTQNTF